MAINRTIKIDGIEVALTCSAATYIRYKDEFNEDLFSKFTEYIEFLSGERDTLPEGSVEMLEKGAYIMAKYSAEKADGNPKDGDDFIKWLEQFTLMGMANDLDKIADVLIADRQGIEDTKKKNEQPSAE